MHTGELRSAHTHTRTRTHTQHTHTCTHTHTHTHTCTHTQIDDYSLVQFQPLDINEEDSITSLLLYIDNAIQYGEDLEVKVTKVNSNVFLLTHVHSLPTGTQCHIIFCVINVIEALP